MAKQAKDFEKIRFEKPGPDTPGYLSRARRALEFNQTIDSGDLTLEELDNLVAFLAGWVTVPEDPEEKIAALYDASENQFKQLLDVLKGGSGEEDSPDENPT